MSRIDALKVFYELLDELHQRAGGFRYLTSCNARTGWPQRGIYFFVDEHELRQSSSGLRVVRVGTHAVSSTSRTTLWQRLAQHRGNRAGTMAGGGNHRGSIFRLHVGQAMLAAAETGANELAVSWGKGGSASREIREREHELECRVSTYIGALPLLWLDVSDAPGTTSMRRTLERRSIALLSGMSEPSPDPPSSAWLGLRSPRAVIRESGLWNVDHVSEAWDGDFFPMLKAAIRRM
jgi:hypothetical protein